MTKESKRYIILFFILLFAFAYSSKLLYIQVFDDRYKKAAENNIIRKVVDYPYRGLIYDRNQTLLVSNEPVYDLMISPKKVKIKDTTRFCRIFGLTKEEFDEKMKKAKKYSYYRPSVFIKKMAKTDYARIQDNLVDYQGFHIEVRTVRSYPQRTMANALGYIREISGSELNRDKSNYYRNGDNIGAKGFEKKYEEGLRGKRGVKFKLVNVKGIVKGSFSGGEYDTLSVAGKNLNMTIDSELQAYAEKLMTGKSGSVVVIEPKTGEILSIVSAPIYDPNLLTGKALGKNYQVLRKDSLKPLFNRAMMATYAPGSILKMVQSLILMQEGVVGPHEKVYCDHSMVGDHAPIGSYDVAKAVKYSSNNFYYKLFKRLIQRGKDDNQFKDAALGLANWNKYMKRFGFGKKTGIDLPGERRGSVPSPQLYDRLYKGQYRWKASNILSLSIGQGELLVTPLQMANMAAMIANRGYYYSPHLLKKVNGENITMDKYTKKNETGIRRELFAPVIKGMEKVVSEKTVRAKIPGITMCGKTGTIQNPHGADHSAFIAFAPKENPKIAIAVYVENSGWGARAAASTASLIVEKYLNKEVKRKKLEDYVLEGNFLDGEFN